MIPTYVGKLFYSYSDPSYFMHLISFNVLQNIEVYDSLYLFYQQRDHGPEGLIFLSKVTRDAQITNNTIQYCFTWKILILVDLSKTQSKVFRLSF